VFYSLSSGERAGLSSEVLLTKEGVKAISFPYLKSFPDE
jgi:hypothetical protein